MTRRKAIPPTREEDDVEIALRLAIEDTLSASRFKIIAWAKKGFIPVVVIEPTEESQRILAKAFQGWKLGVSFFAVRREDYARTLGRRNHVDAGWGSRARQEGDIPVLVFMRDGCLLLNVVDGKSSIEPGSVHRGESRSEN